MGVLDTTYTFTATDVVTSAKLNNVIDQTTFTSSAFSNTTLAINSSGQLRVNSLGITANELADGSVITAKILDNNVTTAKILNDNVTTAKILDANVTQAKIGTNVVGKGPLFSYSVGSNQTIPANSGTILTNYTTSGGDTNNSFSSSAFTAPVAGWYSFLATAETGTANTNFAVYITSNGTLVLHGPQLSATTLKTGVFGILLLSVGDVVKLNAVCSNSIVVNGGYFSGFMIRSA